MFDWEKVRIALPDEEYLRLLGAAICVFDSNCGLIIEGILKVNPDASWHELVDKTSGELKEDIRDNITRLAGDDIANYFSDLAWKRNRIAHGFRITSPKGEQILASKDKKTQIQIHITKDFLWEFICLNEELSELLEQFRTSH